MKTTHNRKTGTKKSQFSSYRRELELKEQLSKKSHALINANAFIANTQILLSKHEILLGIREGHPCFSRRLYNNNLDMPTRIEFK
jgi:hypothetical protein